MMGICRGEGLEVSIWFDDNLVRVVGGENRMFFKLDAWLEGVLCVIGIVICLIYLRLDCF